MGIFRDLVSNVANAKLAEEQNKLGQNLKLGEMLKNLIQNDYASPGDKAVAISYYKKLLSQHGGKAARDMLPSLDSFLTGYLTQQYMQGGPGGQGGVQSPPGGTQPEQGEPTAGRGGQVMQLPPQGQAPGQPGGMNYGWPTATPATLAGAGGGAQQPATRQRGGVGIRGVLRGLAGVGEEMLGIPQLDAGLQYDPALFGPTPTQKAQQAGQLAGQQRAAETAAQMKAVTAQFADPQFLQQMKDRGFSEAQIRDMELRALGIPAASLAKTPMTVYEPDGTKHQWWSDKEGVLYNEMGEPAKLGTGWSMYKLGTDRPGGANDMAAALRPSFQSARIMMMSRYRNPDGTWKQGWSQKRVDDEASVQAAIQYERTSGSLVRGRELKNGRDAALAGLSGVAPPPDWMGEGASFDAQVDAAMGKSPPSVYNQPVPKSGEPITDPAMSAAFDEFVMRATKILPMGRQDEWAQLRYSYGEKIAMAQLGTNNPFDLAAVFEAKKDEAKALSMTIQRVAGVKTLGEQLHAFGSLLEEARGNVDSTGVSLFDRYLQRATKGLGDLSGDQAKMLGRLETALNAVSRIYSQVLANNGYVSSAMPHVGTEQQARETLEAHMSDKTIAAIVDQMYIEVDKDQEVYGKREADQFNELRQGLPETLKRLSGGAAGGGTTITPPPAKKPGTTTPPPRKPGDTGAPPPSGAPPKTGDEFWKKRLGK